ncbi:MAG: hydroxyethylthiazole kinase, partial [Thermoplasmata archaeon]|nr:hydroxyethylthiazole kinase [Thermoplasmata archaeon]
RYPVVATPNASEFDRTFHGVSSAPREELLAMTDELAQRFHATFVVKGPWDVLSDGKRTAQNGHHPSAQNVAGAGDVLGGLLGSLLAQGVLPLHAGRLATYWAGAAGYLAAETRGQGLLASDIVEALPAALVSGLQRVRADGAG